MMKAGCTSKESDISPQGEGIAARLQRPWAALAVEFAARTEITLDEAAAAASRVLQLMLFLRMCEGRQILPDGGLRAIGSARDCAARLSHWLGDLREEFGSGLFFLGVRGGLGLPNGDSSGLRAGEFPMRFELAGPRLGPLIEAVCDCSCVDAAPQPAELLGHVYQHFLGRRVRCTNRGVPTTVAARGQGRPSGVVYTPAGIVAYMVRCALGRRTDASDTPSTEPLPARLLDPACGCGAFLTAACRRLLGQNGPDDKGPFRLALANRLCGVDIDPDAVLIARRALWLILADLKKSNPPRVAMVDLRHYRCDLAQRIAQNVVCGNALSDLEQTARGAPSRGETGTSSLWPPGTFDLVIGNPPYRRERGAQALFESLADTELGRKHRAPRMDLWYYFVHRGLEWLRPGGRLSFVISAYWTAGRGARKLIETLRKETHIAEVTLLGRSAFPEVAGQHMVLTVVKHGRQGPTVIRRAESGDQAGIEAALYGTAPTVVYTKQPSQLFRGSGIDLDPPCDKLLARLARWPRLDTLGRVRQGIAENPATIQRAVNARFGNRWATGEGVFVLSPEEAASLALSQREALLLRPYHSLPDLDRYWMVTRPSRALIYATSDTWPAIDDFPTLAAHLARFRPIMEARRETRRGRRAWWHLHWPRDPEVWQAAKVVSVQMGARPAFVPSTAPCYVPFSANVFVPLLDMREHLYYVTAILNSRLMWKWYRHHAKRRGVGLEINGHVLASTPIRRIDPSATSERAIHDQLVSLVARMLDLRRSAKDGGAAESQTSVKSQAEDVDRQIDNLVYRLYEIEDKEVAAIESGLSLR